MSIASWLSERISDAEKEWNKAVDNGDKSRAGFCLGVVNGLREVEDYIANQESE